jgi:hypothetical protein
LSIEGLGAQRQRVVAEPTRRSQEASRRAGAAAERVD